MQKEKKGNMKKANLQSQAVKNTAVIFRLILGLKIVSQKYVISQHADRNFFAQVPQPLM